MRRFAVGLVCGTALMIGAPRLLQHLQPLPNQPDLLLQPAGLLPPCRTYVGETGIIAGS